MLENWDAGNQIPKKNVIFHKKIQFFIQFEAFSWINRLHHWRTPNITPACILDNYHAKGIFSFHFCSWLCACLCRLRWFKSQWPWLICEGQLTLKQKCSKIHILLIAKRKDKVIKCTLGLKKEMEKKERKKKEKKRESWEKTTKSNWSRNKIHWMPKQWIVFLNAWQTCLRIWKSKNIRKKKSSLFVVA